MTDTLLPKNTELTEPYLSIVKETDPDQFVDLLCANNFFAGSLNGVMPVHENRIAFDQWLAARDTKMLEQADEKMSYTVRGVLNSLNQRIFHSETNPPGQYVKECIFDELKALDEYERGAGRTVPINPERTVEP